MSTTQASLPKAVREGAATTSILRRSNFAVAVIVGLLLVFAVTTPAFLTYENFRSAIGSAALTGTVAVGLTFITLSGNFLPLSVEQSATSVAISLAIALNAGLPVPLALLIAVVVALIVGAVQGYVVSLGANPIIVTLGAGAAIAGIVAAVTGNRALTVDATLLRWLGDASLLGVPISTWIFLAITVVATIFSRHHRRGVEVRLMGENKAAARASGLSVPFLTILAFVLATLAIAVVAILSVSSFGRASTDQFTGLTFNAIAAVLLGGTAIQGGLGSPMRSAFGAVFVALLINMLSLREFSYGARLLVEGIVVVAAVSYYRVRSKAVQK